MTTMKGHHDQSNAGVAGLSSYGMAPHGKVDVVKVCCHCGWNAYGQYETFLYGLAWVCSCCLANSRVLIRKPAEMGGELTIPVASCQTRDRPGIPVH